ncbi:uncharacterized protein LOC143252529 [Tachypleus tridentatus]|uniref:uncharacterized protein LOC143252529 n=1 Tax=Tachypleus tridentatus TaxID=6853 RepID=UPI003FCF0EF7
MVSRGFILMAFVMTSACCWLVQGRYLPTRSDETRKEQIKEILRALLELNHDDGQEPDWQQSWYNYRLPLLTLKRSISDNFSRK